MRKTRKKYVFFILLVMFILGIIMRNVHRDVNDISTAISFEGLSKINEKYEVGRYNNFNIPMNRSYDGRYTFLRGKLRADKYKTIYSDYIFDTQKITLEEYDENILYEGLYPQYAKQIETEDNKIYRPIMEGNLAKSILDSNGKFSIVGMYDNSRIEFSLEEAYPELDTIESIEEQRSLDGKYLYMFINNKYHILVFLDDGSYEKIEEEAEWKSSFEIIEATKSDIKYIVFRNYGEDESSGYNEVRTIGYKIEGHKLDKMGENIITYRSKMALSPTGKYVYNANTDNYVEIYNMEKKKIAYKFKNNALLISNKSTGLVCFYDNDKKAFILGERRIAWSYYNMVWYINMETGRKVIEKELSDLAGIALKNSFWDGEKLYIVTDMTKDRKMATTIHSK